MSSFELPLQKSMLLNLAAAAPELAARLIDRGDGSWLLRAPEVFADGEVPDFVELAFGHQNAFWRVPVEVKAGYAPWLILTPPDIEDARKLQRRSFVRISLSTRLIAIPTTASGTQRGAPVALDLLNFSAGGCLATATESPGEPGDHLVVVLDLPGLPALPTPSQVVRAQDGRYGIQFQGLKGQTRDGVVRFVTDQIAHHLQRGRDITLPEPERPTS